LEHESEPTGKQAFSAANVNPESSAHSIFNNALELDDPAARARYVDEACAGDTQLCERVKKLLHAHDEAGGFFSQPSKRTAADAALPLTERTGDSIGRYKLLEQIGEGGCGVVYMAEQQEPVRRRVALKVIKLGMDTKQVVARFEAERQALALMEHPNIAKVLDAGATASGRPFFVMELVRGRKISEFCDEKKLSTDERLKLFVTVCHAVQHAHQKGIIHRDLKPSNILVTTIDGAPVPKVIDFGIAKATSNQPLTDKTLFTAFEQFIGTPAYMSPEQAEMSGVDIDTRTDIYSLGVLLYELLTSRTPFEQKELLAAGLDAMRRTIREEEPACPSNCLSTMAADALTTTAQQRQTEPPKLLDLVRGDLDWIVMKCLEKDRARRYDTANGLAMDIKRHLENEFVLARPPSAAYRLKKLVLRNKLAFAAGASVFLALIVGLGVTNWALLREQRARRETELRRQEAETARADEKQQRVRAEAEELNARRSAYASDMNLVQQAYAANNLGRAREVLERNRPKPGQIDLRGWEWRYLWNRCQGDALFTLGRQNTRLITFIGAGELVALRNTEGGVELWELEKHALVTRLPAAGWDRALDASYDGQWLAYGNIAGNGQPIIELWSIGTKEVVTRLASNGQAMSLAFDPSGRRLAVYGDDRSVSLWDLESKKIAKRFAAAGPDGLFKGVVRFSPSGNWLAIGETDGHVHLVDAGTCEVRISFRAASEGITALAFSPDGMLLASGSGYANSAVQLWKIPSGDSEGSLAEHTGWISALAFTPQGKALVSASADQTIRVWNVGDRKQIFLLRGHLDEVHTLALSRDGAKLVSGSRDGEVCVWDPNRKASDKASLVASASVSQARFLPNSQSFVCVNQNGSVSLWASLEAKEIEKLAKLGSNNFSCAIAADGKFMAVGDRSGQLKIWDFKAGKEVSHVKGHDAPVAALALIDDGKVLLSVDRPLSGDRGSVIKRWQVDSWRQLAQWQVEPGVTAMTVSPDERILVSVLMNGMTKLWNSADGHELGAFTAGPGLTSAVAFLPDGKLLATSSENGFVKLWDSITLKERAVLKGHLLGVHALGISPDGRRLASGSNASEAVKLWDLSSGRELLNLSGEGELFHQTTFSPDHRLLLSVPSRGKLHLWRAPSLDEIDTVERDRLTTNSR
jgi:WD40 repeat protein/serine/threonine protein kinase